MSFFLIPSHGGSHKRSCSQFIRAIGKLGLRNVSLTTVYWHSMVLLFFNVCCYCYSPTLGEQTLCAIVTLFGACLPVIQIIPTRFSLNAYFLFPRYLLSITRRMRITCIMIVKKIALVRDAIELRRVLGSFKGGFEFVSPMNRGIHFSVPSMPTVIKPTPQ